ncbi:MAG: alanine--glyoxylate aminotransferase family protein [Methanobacteriota archaeon]|nr:MAG: alanine--glyoxylate aminotransferase family protein [Euryarchaeota archaeon]
MPDPLADVFLLPGPVKMDPRVLQAMARPAMNHRGPEFKEILADVRTLTQYLFGTKGEVAVLSGSGTAGLEASVTGLVRKEDRVLNLVNGKFSQRFHELCGVFAHATALSFEWGTAVDPKHVAEALDAGAFRAVTVCWNETSTGLTNPMAEIARVVKAHDAFLIVDGITAVGGLENQMDAWGIDALVMGSQKCLAAPAGLSAVALSKAAYDSLHSDASFYTNLKAHVDALAKQDTPYTPAVPLFLAFREALMLLKEEGLSNRIARTKRLADAARSAVEALGLRLFPDRGFASNTVSAIRYPAGVEDTKFRTILRESHRTIVAGGQDHLKGRIFRIGHMGVCTFEDLEAGFRAIEATLVAEGYSFQKAAGVEAIRARSRSP